MAMTQYNTTSETQSGRQGCAQSGSGSIVNISATTTLAGMTQ